MKQTLWITLGVGVLLCGAGGRSFAQAQPATESGTLAGVSSVMLLVAQNLPDLDSQGLSSADITKYITDKLTGGGIKVVAPSAANFRTGGLEVTVTGAKASDEDAYAVSLVVAFHQPAKLARNSSILADAITWHRTDVTFATAGALPQFKNAIGSDLDAFVADYKVANNLVPTTTGTSPTNKTGDIQVAPVPNMAR